MVWGILPVDPLSGEDKYYIFSKGTYKVGRKGCDVIINDKGVSRIHAEIFIDAMVCLDSPEYKSSIINSYARIKDCSKYGTNVGQNGTSKKKVHECPNKETTLKDGDLISFGTGNFTYRFCFVPFIFFVWNFKASQVTRSIQEKVSSVGACMTQKWSRDCTHVIVDQYTTVNEDLLDAMVTTKPFVLHNWLEVFAENKIRCDIPSCSTHVPTLMLDGASVAVADARTRQNCLKGYTFLLESPQMYKFGNRLSLLLEVGGANVLSTEIFDSNSQLHGGSNDFLHVIPAGSADCLRNRGSLMRINEMDLVRAVASGYLDRSVLISPSIIVSSSCSTDETVVADSDAETESATSDEPAEVAVKPTVESQSKDEKLQYDDDDAPTAEKGASTYFTVDCSSSMIREQKSNDPPKRDFVSSSRNTNFTTLINRSDSRTAPIGKDSDPESGNPDIRYIRNFIVRRVNTPSPAISETENNVINFKRFRKTEIQSGNSFSNLIPFAKHPYSHSDSNKEVDELVREEKKRKQMEAIAEDLFNNEKGRQRRAAVNKSLHSLLTSR
ncbi:Mre11 complex subunit Nbs1 [Dionaea muscipula]